MFSFPPTRAGNYTTCNEAPIVHAHMTNRGKPRTRSEDVLQRDVLQILGTRGWARKGWIYKRMQAFLSDARAQKGLYRHAWEEERKQDKSDGKMRKKA